MDEGARGSPGVAACGGIFRDTNGAFSGGFALHLGISIAFHAELMAAMKAIELAIAHYVHCICLESDSSVVVVHLKILIAFLRISTTSGIAALHLFTPLGSRSSTSSVKETFVLMVALQIMVSITLGLLVVCYS